MKLILWMAQHWMFLTIMGFTLAGVFFFGAWWLYGRFIKQNNGRIVIRPGQILRRFWRRRGGSGTIKMNEHDMPLLERRDSDLEGRRDE